MKTGYLQNISHSLLTICIQCLLMFCSGAKCCAALFKLHEVHSKKNINMSVTSKLWTNYKQETALNAARSYLFVKTQPCFQHSLNFHNLWTYREGRIRSALQYFITCKAKQSKRTSSRFPLINLSLAPGMNECKVRHKQRPHTTSYFLMFRSLSWSRPLSVSSDHISSSWSFCDVTRAHCLLFSAKPAGAALGALWGCGATLRCNNNNNNSNNNNKTVTMLSSFIDAKQEPLLTERTD